MVSRLPEPVPDAEGVLRVGVHLRRRAPISGTMATANLMRWGRAHGQRRRPAPARRIIVAGCRISAVSTSGTASTIITGWNPDFNKYDRLGLILRRIR